MPGLICGCAFAFDFAFAFESGFTADLGVLLRYVLPEVSEPDLSVLCPDSVLGDRPRDERDLDDGVFGGGIFAGGAGGGTDGNTGDGGIGGSGSNGGKGGNGGGGPAGCWGLRPCPSPSSDRGRFDAFRPPGLPRCGMFGSRLRICSTSSSVANKNCTKDVFLH